MTPKSPEEQAAELYPYPPTDRPYVPRYTEFDIVDMKRAAFIAGFEADKWIKVEDDLPHSKFGNYLVTLKNEVVLEMTYSDITKKWFKPGIGREHVDNPVTHWQPLPQPAKKK